MSPGRFVRTEELMGTVASVHVVGDVAPESVEDAVAACLAELRDTDALFSPYLPESAVSRIRRGELTLEDADERVRQVARACADAERETGGLFSARWRGGFDPTGYVKGWAAEHAARRWLGPLVHRTGVRAAGLNVGGDMQLFTAPGEERPWRIGIADPAHAGTLVATLEVRDGAVATSGTAERGAHVTDPRTGRAATGARSATVVADGLARADVWATAALVAGVDDLSWLARAATRAGIVVGEGGRIRRWVGATEVSVAPHAA